MFGGGAMVSYGGSFDPSSQAAVDEFLEKFSRAVVDAAVRRGVGRGRSPFGRPSNFVVLLDRDSLHLVVDRAPAGAMPTHYYINQSQRGISATLDGLIGEAVRDLGFENPLGVSMPISVLHATEQASHATMLGFAERVAEGLAEQVKVESLNLPVGYHHYARFFPAFLRDHPRLDRNVFLMMRFKTGKQYDEITRSVKEALRKRGMELLRADDRSYSDDLWENVCLYMLGCTYGVAVFEEIDLREFNPSVALELGFMLALNKRCLILKDSRMSRMPTDIIGKLYKEFDTYRIPETIPLQIDQWVNDLGIEDLGIER